MGYPCHIVLCYRFSMDSVSYLFHWADYLVLTLVLIASCSVGVCFKLPCHIVLRYRLTMESALFHWADYLVLTLVLITSCSVGVYYGFPCLIVLFYRFILSHVSMSKVHHGFSVILFYVIGSPWSQCQHSSTGQTTLS